MRLAALTGAYRRRAPGEPRAIGYLYILPALILYAVFLLYPFGQSVWLSFVHWDGLTVATPAGFDNYRALFTDASLRAPSSTRCCCSSSTPRCRWPSGCCWPP
ncbi:hypothetical protein SVIO_093850 [Streptomyces violaceusniger]|uniref:ABC transmembrane type-1 domain-containing protein n=1 Tax=Streptomyces violaceusniger TaxID=68280 RepID=A0A4D4LBZ2_STRVO|nr:hypothetical protein SVIO_093850 [Streptomyces violaceusniger]